MLKKYYSSIMILYTFLLYTYYSSLCSVYIVFQFNDNFNLTIYLLPPNHIVKLRTDCIRKVLLLMIGIMVHAVVSFRRQSKYIL